MDLCCLRKQQKENTGRERERVPAKTDRVGPQAPQAENRWCMRQLVYIENCMGKSPNVKKLCK